MGSPDTLERSSVENDETIATFEEGDTEVLAPESEGAKTQPDTRGRMEIPEDDPIFTTSIGEMQKVLARHESGNEDEGEDDTTLETPTTVDRKHPMMQN